MVADVDDVCDKRTTDVEADMAPDPTRHDVLQALQHLVSRSTEVNAALMENGTAFLKYVSEEKPSLSELVSSGSEIINRGLADYVAMSARHTTQVISLGLDVSDNLLANVRSPSRPTETLDPALFDMPISGRPGTTCQAAFVLENDGPTPITTSFARTDLLDPAGAPANGFGISFNPPTVEVPAGQKAHVVVSVGIPEGAATGVYRSTVVLADDPRKRFLLVLTVDTPATEPPESVKEHAAMAPAADETKPASSADAPTMSPTSSDATDEPPEPS